MTARLLARLRARLRALGEGFLERFLGFLDLDFLGFLGILDLDFLEHFLGLLGAPAISLTQETPARGWRSFIV